MAKDQVEKPPWATLEAGVTEEDLRTAITQSGFPLQAAVADVIESAIKAVSEPDAAPVIQEEWAYLDRESGQIRAIDIFAEVPFSSRPSIPDGERPLFPCLNLLVECKQSYLPFVFFLRGRAPGLSGTFPEIVGPESNDIDLYRIGSDRKSVIGPFTISVQDALRVWSEDFFDLPAPYAVSISKTARRGSKLELTGEEAYKSITLPLLKAADYLHTACAYSEDSPAVRFGMIVSLAVIRAPMIGVHNENGEETIGQLPWVRAYRLEPGKAGSGHVASNATIRFFDVVHESFLPEYLEKLLAAASTISRRAETMRNVIIDGRCVSAGDQTFELFEPIPRDAKLPPGRQGSGPRLFRSVTSAQIMFAPSEWD
ncbi:hypothetical protein GCM10009557_05470 [Virgisporangium ochraceum]|uniref:Uncharacterized protein n=1 Tax=Virgisporangium ochraceum TaxID=65505 RepID=A0A8J3ZUN7_9ACTN|nr:hypothetical protein [Virgisporangium ochraceum]GIJ69976.1 hypothetical protein Voc01_048930 [Virgisporangium ochraceum]